MNPQHARLLAAAVEYDRGDARRIQHFVKVHDLAAAMTKAQLALQYTVAVRDKAMAAYKEIMQMQV